MPSVTNSGHIHPFSPVRIVRRLLADCLVFSVSVCICFLYKVNNIAYSAAGNNK